MASMRRSFIAIVAGLSVAAFAWQASAQQDERARDQAMAKCIKQAQTQYPLDADDQMNNRTALYKSCMTNAGFRP